MGHQPTVHRIGTVLRYGSSNWDTQVDFEPEHSIRHNAIGIGQECVYLIDGPHATEDESFDLVGGRSEAKQRAAVIAESEEEELRRLREHLTDRLLALNIETSKVLWNIGDDVFGTILAFSAKRDVLLMSFQPDVLLDLTTKCLNNSKWLAVKGDVALDRTVMV